MIRLSKKCAEITLGEPVAVLANLKLNLRDVDKNLAVKDFYGKTIEHPGQNEQTHMIRFTALPSEVDAYFQSHRQHAANRQSIENR